MSAVALAEIEGVDPFEHDPAVRAPADWPAFPAHCRSRSSSAPPWCAARIRNPWRCLHRSGHDRSDARCCRPCRWLPPSRSLASSPSRNSSGTVLDEIGQRDPQLLHVFVAIGRGAIAARIDDLLVPHLDLDHVLRQFAARVPEIDLERQRVAPRPRIEHPFQRRVRDQAAVPEILVADPGRGKAGRQRARRQRCARKVILCVEESK